MFVCHINHTCTCECHPWSYRLADRHAVQLCQNNHEVGDGYKGNDEPLQEPGMSSSSSRGDQTGDTQGVRVVMVTGDNVLTATTVARRLGIISTGASSDSLAMSCSDIKPVRRRSFALVHFSASLLRAHSQLCCAMASISTSSGGRKIERTLCLYS